MLRELHLTDLGVLHEVGLELHPGLNVLTGETGAGKTLVTVGLALALGRRATSSLVRDGAKAARVQARFDAVPAALEAGWGAAGELVLARAVSADGRSTARIDGELAPVSALTRLADDLVEVHGQHEGTRLLSAAAQTAFLDRSAGDEHLRALDGLAQEHEALRAARAALAAIDERERDRARDLDLLAYQVRELEAAAPAPGEIARLELEETGLAHAERLLADAAVADAALADDGGADDTVAAAAARIRAIAEVDPRAAELAERAEAISAGLSELGRDLRGYRESVQLDPGRLEEVRDRVGALQGLLRKYGPTEADAVAFLDDARERLADLERADEDRERLAAECAERGDRVAALATVISDGRREAAPALAAALRGELQELGMEGAALEIELVPDAQVSATGAEHVVFRFSGGPGQGVLPLAKVASGGELSRTMLACRSVLADLDDVPTLVFDEVDAGIGGRAGVAVGRRLAALARTRQVLVVTHLPQIAAFADRHVRVHKRGGAATVHPLDDAGRVDELTRMLSGLPGSEAASTHAEELLAEAAAVKDAIEAAGDRPARARRPRGAVADALR
jgi:DNA repair protein RecN (Recombination protein N)